MLDLLKPLALRNGTEVVLLCSDISGDYALAGTIIKDSGEKELYMWTKEGSFFADEDNMEESGLDLVNVPKTYHLNVYRGCHTIFPYGDREQADRAAGTDRIACVKVTEGQFDS